jgi:hypothetical protein
MLLYMLVMHAVLQCLGCYAAAGRVAELIATEVVRWCCNCDSPAGRAFAKQCILWALLHGLPGRMLRCRGIDHHWRDDTFATAGAAVDVWDHQRSEPVTSLTWGADSMHSVRFNPVRRVASVRTAAGL